MRKQYISKRFIQGRVQEAITERYRKGVRPKLDLKQGACLIAFSCSTPSDGRKDWTMQLLADRLVEVGVGWTGTEACRFCGHVMIALGSKEKRGGGPTNRVDPHAPACLVPGDSYLPFG
jgi:hypothetical protein